MVSRFRFAALLFLPFVLLFAALLLFAGCKKMGQSPDQTTLQRIRETGSVKVAFANEAPYAYLDETTGKLTGEAPEITRRVFESMGIEDIEGVLVEWGALIPSLKAGRVDMIAAGMYVTPERCEQIAFSEPTYCVGEAFLVKKGNPANLHSFEDVKDNDKTILGVVSGTVEVGYAQKIGVPDERIIRFPDNAAAAAGVKAGRVDAFAGTSLTVGELLRRLKDKDLEQARPFTNPVIDGKPTKGCGAFGFRQEDDQLLQNFNEHLALFLGTNEHKELVEIFGFGEDERAADVTTHGLCASGPGA